MTLYFEARSKIRGLNGIFKMTAIVGSNFWPIVIEDLNFYGFLFWIWIFIFILYRDHHAEIKNLHFEFQRIPELNFP